MRTGSFLAGKKLKINEILLLEHLWLCKASWSATKSVTGFQGKTITKYFGNFRNQVELTLDIMDTKIGGEGIEVEINESKFGKVKYHRGHQVQGVWIIGGVERTRERKCFLAVVHDRSSKTLIQCINEHVNEGSTIYTDYCRAYLELRNHGYLHYRVNHSENWPRNRTKNITHHLFEFIWRRIKAHDLWNSILEAISLPTAQKLE